MSPKNLVFVGFILYVLLHAIQSAAQEPKLILPLGHTSSLYRVVFSDDKKRLISLSQDNTIMVWDITTGLLLKNQQLPGDFSFYSRMVFAPNGKTIVSMNNEGYLSLFDVQNFKLSKITRAKKKLTIKTGDEVMDIISGDYPTKLDTAATIKIKVDSSVVNADILSTDSTEPTSPKKRDTVYEYSNNNVLVFSPDSRQFLFALDDKMARVVAIDKKSDTLVLKAKGQKNPITAAAFSRDNKLIVTVARYENPRIWDAKTGKLLKIIPSKAVSVDSVSFLSFDNRLLIEGYDTIRSCKVKLLYNSSTGRQIAGFNGDTLYTFADNSEMAITAISDSLHYLLDTRANKICGKIQQKSILLSCEFATDGKTCLLSTLDSGFELIDGQTGVQIVKLNYGYYGMAKYSRNGKLLVVQGSKRGSLLSFFLNILDAHTGKILAVQNLTYPVNFMDFSPDDRMLVTACDDGVIEEWNLITGRPLAELIGHTSEPLQTSLSPDGKKFLAVYHDVASRVINSERKNTSAYYTPKPFVYTKVWDMEKGMPLFTIKNAYNQRLEASFSTDTKKIFFSGEQSQEFDAINGVLSWPNRFDDYGYSAQISPDGGRFVSFGGTDLIEGRVSPSFFGDEIENIKWVSGTISASFSNNGRYLEIEGYRKLAVLDLENDLAHMAGEKENFEKARIAEEKATGKSTRFDPKPDPVLDIDKDTSFVKLEANVHLAHLVAFSPDDRKMTATGDRKTYIWDIPKDTLLATLKSDLYEDPQSAQFSPDGERLLTNGFGNLKLWNAENGEFIASPSSHATYSLARFSDDNTRLITTSIDDTVRIFDAHTFTFLSKFPGGQSEITSAGFFPGGKRIFTISHDAMTIRNAANGDLINSFYSFDGDDYFDQIASGYYLCTPNAAKLLHYVTKDFNVITFEQLDIKYNRPDKVLQAIGCKDTALINSYYRAYEKRIQRLHLDTSKFKSGYSVPKADYMERDKIDYTQNKRDMQLRISGIDSLYDLDRFNVWINGVPIYGINGVDLKSRKNDNHRLDTTVNISLGNGTNRLETSVTNVNGTESYHVPLNVNYTAVSSADTGKLYFIGIGIDDFADSTHDLEWSVNDISNLAEAFKKKYENTCEIHTLFDKDVTKDNVKALRSLLTNTNINDKVIIAYSGHGLLSSNYDYYLSTYNVQFDRPEKEGLPYEELEHLIEDIPARKKLMLIDACHSGEVDKEDIKAYQASIKKLQSNGVETGRIWQKPKGKKILGTPGSFELMQHLFADVSKNSGAIVISAAAGQQLAMERGDLHDGVFTYCILNYMQTQPHCNISQLKNYVNEQVVLLTNGLQRPTTRSENNAVDWQIW